MLRYPYQVYYYVANDEAQNSTYSALLPTATRHPKTIALMSSPFTLRPYTAADENAAVELWRRTWQQHYPQIDFNDRVAWWRARWRDELVANATITWPKRAAGLSGS